MASASKRWSSRSLASRFAHGIFYTTIHYAGRKTAYFMLYFVVFFYTCLPGIRDRSKPYRLRRFGQRSIFKAWGDCFSLHMQFARMLVDRATKGILDDFHLEAETGHPQLLRDLASRGKGLILLTAHVGCWQLGMSVLDHVDVPKAVVMLRDHADVDRHYFEHAPGRRPAFSIIDPSGPLGGVIEMLGALQQGAALCMMGDREFGSAKALVTVELLGSPARLPVSPYHLASAAQAPVAIVFSRSTGPGKGAIWVDDVIEVPEGLGRDNAAYTPYAQRFADALSRYSAQYPLQFYNFFDLWTEQR